MLPLAHIITIFAVLTTGIYSLSGQQASQACHCDLTSSFCDFDCCCDLDCSTSVSDACFNYRSAEFCIDSTFYYKINPMKSLVSTGEQGCYYFNITTQIQEEVVLPTWQLKYFASEIKLAESLSQSVTEMYNGYEANDEFPIAGTASLYLIDANGGCILDGNTGTYASTIRFGANFDLTCIASTNSINLFADVLGRTISKYRLDTSSASTITIPSPSGSFTSATVYFILETYGSQKALYIQDVQVRTSNDSGSTKRSLSFRFVYPELNYEQEVEDPSFFPQIPYDIFYPIHQIAYTF